MSRTDDVPAVQPAVAKRQGGRLRLSAMVACALLGGVVGGTGSFAVAAGPWQGGWHGGGHDNDRLGHLQRMVRGALDSVGATTAQEDKIHDIIATNFADMDHGRDEHEALHKRMLDLLRAPTVDRAAVEKLRSDQAAAFDAHSKKLVGALLDAADQLSPEQRTKLADRLATMGPPRHGMGGPWGGHGGPEDGHDGPPPAPHFPMDGPKGPGAPEGGPERG